MPLAAPVITATLSLWDSVMLTSGYFSILEPMICSYLG